MPDTYAVIAAGGTGGHVVPGLAVAAALTARGHRADAIHFVGSSHGIDAQLVPDAGFPMTLLPGRGVPRHVGLAALRAVGEIMVGVVRGVRLVRRLRPRVVVAFGGYASVPCIVAAVVWRVPLVVVARDARAGAADRFGGRFARACAVPFPETDLPRAVVTGNPLRAELVEAARDPDRAAACARLALPPERVVIGVFTGSLGSRRVNEAVHGLVERWRLRTDVAIRHVIGTRDWDSEQARCPTPPADGLVYAQVRYEDHMELMLAASDLAVTRAGGATVAELAVTGVPAILVPLPIAPRDHQTANAEALVAVGGAVRVPDDQCDTDRLERELEALVSDVRRRATMSKALTTVAHPDAADRVADLVEEHAR